jgi:hypothetical protein
LCKTLTNNVRQLLQMGAKEDRQQEPKLDWILRIWHSDGLERCLILCQEKAGFP